MATTTNLTTTFVGDYVGEYLLASILSANSLTNGIMELKTRVYSGQVVKRLDLSGNLWQDAQCDFNADGTVTIDERKIDPKRFQINKQLCKVDFFDDWETKDMGNTALNPRLARRLQETMILKVLGDHKAMLENTIWKGVDGAGSFDGFETRFLADPNVNDIASPVAIDATNVIDEIGRVYDACPEALKDMPNFQIGVSSNVYRAYIRALGGFGVTGHAGIRNEGPLTSYPERITFENTTIVKCNGMSDNTMVATYRENLWFGTLAMSDHGQIKLRDQDAVDGSDNVNFIAKFSANVQYGWGRDIYFYQAP